ncbi:MAG: hypothetical protein AVO35_05120 [Candidatus Aegiribacteria sp. MLS_C]|nr:MAG: hypothetical protein AVO35_05120 [Candidatus Aegiribacteria sp. MLS_C]
MSAIDWSDPESAGELVVRQALEEDRAFDDPATSALGPAAFRTSVCSVSAREPTVVAGWFLLEKAFEFLSRGPGDDEVAFRQLIPEGKRVEGGRAIGTVTGPAHILLRGERVGLNLLCRLSGIASLTRMYVDAVTGTGVEVLDTRKTTPCLRALEKYAVRMGGGVNHRMDLSGMAMIKDNHLAVLGGADHLGTVMERLRRKQLPVEIEVDSIPQLRRVLDEKPDRILLDNMDVSELREAVGICAGTGVYLEASGGITLDNIRQYAETGVDGISCGALTHSARSADIGLDWERA